MDELLHALLLANGPISAIVGPRIYWGLAPQGVVAPYVTMQIISTIDAPHMQGAGGLLTYRVQINCYGVDRPTARGLGNTVRAQINGTRSGKLRLILLDSARDGYVETAGGGLSVAMLDFIVTWRA